MQKEEHAFETSSGKYPTLQAGQEAFRKFMKQPSSTAIITYNDLQAMGFITSARQHHVEIPGRFSVIGIDDTPNCTLISPRSAAYTSTVARRKTATAILFGMVNGRNQSNAGKQGLWEIPTSFIERDSIGIPLADC
ncbi:MAG: substrate-binding domain-containing protein [Bifidobacterium breve]